MRRGSVVQLIAIGVICGAGAALVAILIPWLPDPASRQAGRIDFVFWFVTAISIAIFALVAPVDGHRFRFVNRIPLERGLGSSAATVAAGLGVDGLRGVSRSAGLAGAGCAAWVDWLAGMWDGVGLAAEALCSSLSGFSE